MGILFICTGNQCRSPMAAALLRANLGGTGERIPVESAGFVSEGRPSPPEVLATMAALGIDLSAHRSRLVRPDLLASADLVVGMTRQHVVDAAALLPAVWSRTFTLVELARRGAGAGRRQPGEAMAGWLSRVNSGRTRASIVSLSLAEDIPDPLGGRRRAYQRTRDQLSGLIDRVTDLILPA